MKLHHISDIGKCLFVQLGEDVTILHRKRFCFIILIISGLCNRKNCLIRPGYKKIADEMSL